MMDKCSSFLKLRWAYLVLVLDNVCVGVRYSKVVLQSPK